MHRLFRLDLNQVDHRNAWYLVVEIFWASMLAAAATFNAAFAIRLGASNSEISLLSSVPALMAVLVSIPAGRFLRRRPHRRPWLRQAMWRSSRLLIGSSYLAFTAMPRGAFPT